MENLLFHNDFIANSHISLYNLYAPKVFVTVTDGGIWIAVSARPVNMMNLFMVCILGCSVSLGLAKVIVLRRL